SKAALPMQRLIAGGQANRKDWWENLPISAKTYPLKTLQMLNDYFQILVESRVSNVMT
ncbi:hypothetical protein BDR04DRAFT_1086331, partial [Suillus decipiens]